MTAPETVERRGIFGLAVVVWMMMAQRRMHADIEGDACLYGRLITWQSAQPN